MQKKLKILIIGPPKSGKSAISNFLSEAGEAGNKDYRPTKGCRILEFEVPNVNQKGVGNVKVEVELWDASGDRVYETCWPVIQHGAHGVIFVYNPDKNDTIHYLDDLFTQFVNTATMKPGQCAVFCHIKPESRGHTAIKLCNIIKKFLCNV